MCKITDIKEEHYICEGGFYYKNTSRFMRTPIRNEFFGGPSFGSDFVWSANEFLRNSFLITHFWVSLFHASLTENILNHYFFKQINHNSV